MRKLAMIKDHEKNAQRLLAAEMHRNWLCAHAHGNQVASGSYPKLSLPTTHGERRPQFVRTLRNPLGPADGEIFRQAACCREATGVGGPMRQCANASPAGPSPDAPQPGLESETMLCVRAAPPGTHILTHI